MLSLVQTELHEVWEERPSVALLRRYSVSPANTTAGELVDDHSLSKLTIDHCMAGFQTSIVFMALPDNPKTVEVARQSTRYGFFAEGEPLRESSTECGTDVFTDSNQILMAAGVYFSDGTDNKKNACLEAVRFIRAYRYDIYAQLLHWQKVPILTKAASSG